MSLHRVNLDSASDPTGGAPGNPGDPSDVDATSRLSADDIEYLPQRPSGHVLDLDSDAPVNPSSPVTQLASVEDPSFIDPGRAPLAELLRQAAAQRASDLHLAVGSPPLARIDGVLKPLGADRLRSGQVRALLQPLLPSKLVAQFETSSSFDSSLVIAGQSDRYRLNAYRAQGEWRACLRRITTTVPTLADLKFPAPLAERLLTLRDGLVIFTGSTGAGKSSSLASLVQQIAHRRSTHILAVEEPIEFLYKPVSGCLFSQREVGRDVDSFAEGLRQGLRQDPDVILVGEARDRDTAQMVLSAAETGHLVFTTLHTRDAPGGITRLVDLFPAEAQPDVRRQLGMSLRAVIGQRLLPAARGPGRVLALEVLFNTPACAQAIRSGRIESLTTLIQTGKRDGMQTFEDAINQLVASGLARG